MSPVNLKALSPVIKWESPAVLLDGTRHGVYTQDALVFIVELCTVVSWHAVIGT